MHALEPHTRYRIFPVLMAVPETRDNAAVADAINNMLNSHLQADGPTVIADWFIEKPIGERATDADVEEGDVFSYLPRVDHDSPKYGKLPAFAGKLDYLVRILRVSGDINRDWVIDRLRELRREIEDHYADNLPSKALDPNLNQIANELEALGSTVVDALRRIREENEAEGGHHGSKN